jgi:DNA-binding NarL/FixJ family response regulator
MTTALRSKSMADIQAFAHKLAGSSAFLELKTIARFLSELEQAALQGESRQAARLLGLVKTEFALIQSHRASQKRGVKPPLLESPPRASQRKLKIFIVDDHPLIREGLVRLVDRQPDLKFCGQATTAYQALKAIPVLKPDLVILDITLAGSDGMGLIKDMKLRAIKSFILVLSMHDELLYAERALRAGAKGYIMKQESPKELLKAIYRILEDEIYLSPKMEAKMLHKIADSAAGEKTLPEGSLSDRELQTFQLIGQGRGTREIAEELHISPKTVESYRAHIKVKMDLKNAHELTQHAVHWVESNHLN